MMKKISLNMTNHEFIFGISDSPFPNARFKVLSEHVRDWPSDKIRTTTLNPIEKLAIESAREQANWDIFYLGELSIDEYGLDGNHQHTLT